MSGPRYSIIPHEFFDDSRLTLAHVKVMASLCRHTNRLGWCRLKQGSIATEAGCTRQTACSALADLVDWGHVEKHKKEAGQSLLYRVVMDSRVAPPDDLPEEEIHTSVHKTGVSAVGDKGDVASDTTPMSPLGRQGCRLSPDNKNVSLTNNKRKSEDSNFDLKSEGKVAAALMITSRDTAKWKAWLDYFAKTGVENSVALATQADLIIASSYWPGDNVVWRIPEPEVKGLTSRSLAMTGEGA